MEDEKQNRGDEQCYKNLQPRNFQATKIASLPTATPVKQKTKNYEKAYL